MLLLVLVGAGVAAAADIGHEDFAATGDAITGSKPESKLWYNDGKWWASMWSTSRRTSTSTGSTPAPRRGSGRRRPSTTDWGPVRTRCGTGRTCTSPRSTSNEDGGETGTGSSHETRLYRYTYNTTTNTYTLDGGFPASMRTSIQSETLVIAKDSTGTLWATWTLAIGVVNRSTRTTRSAATTRTGRRQRPCRSPAAIVANDDISSIIAFTVAGQHRIGVFWSNQVDAKDYFAWQPDGGPDNDWTAETALVGIGRQAAARRRPHEPEDRLERQGLRRREDEQHQSSQPLIQLLDRSTGGAWSAHTVGRVADSNTRAILELDTSAAELHVFMTGRHDGIAGPGGRRHLREDVADVRDLVRRRRPAPS